MKADIHSLTGTKKGTTSLPKQFEQAVRQDLIKRANEVIEANNRTPYGAFPWAGRRASADLSRRRRKFRGSYGHGISRVPRKHLWRRGTQFGWIGAFAPGTVSGRRAHPPKASKILTKKININEKRKAICSAISATIIPEVVKERGHKFTNLTPIIESKIESINKTKDVKDLLIKLKLEKELERISQKKVRPGKGKMRGRKYKTRKGPLFVVSKQCPLEKSASNLLGIEVCQVQNLNVSLLAPGGNPGRLTMFSEDAIKRLSDEKLFLTRKNRTKTKPKKKEVKKKVTKK